MPPNERTSFYDMSVAENIGYSHRGTPTEMDTTAVKRLVHRYGLTDLLAASLGRGSIDAALSKPAGAKGKNLSSGQKQIVSFLRTLAKDVPILILDEVTANLDAESTAIIVEITRAVCASGKTVIALSHNLQTIRDFDTIYVLERGEVADFGSHDELMVHRGLYAELVDASNIASRRSSNAS